MAVTLTFDNGPAPGTTERVLDVLGERGLGTTFFVVGRELEKDGARLLAERAVSEGHWIGNHSLTHAVPLGDDPDPASARQEIEGAEALIGDLSHPRRFFRPFGGGGILGPHLLSPAAVDVLRDGGFTCVLWTSVPRDWEDPEGWVDVALADVEHQTDTVVEITVDNPDAVAGAAARRPQARAELDRWLAGDHTDNNTFRSH